VRYPETDRMGVAHHTHFLVWFELGRTELMRRAGMPYGRLEDEGLFFPVVELGTRFLRPARYDEELEVHTVIAELRRARVRFEYRLHRPEESEPLALGHTVHAAVDRAGRPVRIPPGIRSALEGA
jgi:acyl-CoA thioester hydrolase